MEKKNINAGIVMWLVESQTKPTNMPFNLASKQLLVIFTVTCALQLISVRNTKMWNKLHRITSPCSESRGELSIGIMGPRS